MDSLVLKHILSFITDRKTALALSFTCKRFYKQIQNLNPLFWIKEENKLYQINIKNQLEGIFKKFFNGSTFEEGRYKKGKKTGPWLTYTPEGIKNQVTYKKGVENGLTIIHQLDMIKHFWYKNGKLDGLCKVYYKGKLYKIYYWRNDREDGYYYNFLNMEQGFQLECLRNGFILFYRNDGSLYCSHYYVNGLKDGDWCLYYPDGKLFQTGQYKKDRKDGLFITYNIQGQVLEYAEYKNDIQNGIYQLYSDGELICSYIYEQDEIVSRLYYINKEPIYKCKRPKTLEEWKKEKYKE